MKPQPRSATRRPLRGSGDQRPEHPSSPDLAQRPSECSQDTGTTGSVKYLDLLHKFPGLREVAAIVERISAANVPVLITGPNGAGKEVVARAIAETDRVPGRSFLAANCASIHSGMFESEVFGHVRGAFTGAERDHAGLLQRAGNGVVFLDEVGELELGLQAKLLRVLQSREFTPLGGTQGVPLEARVIAATNRDLPAMVRSGAFREDLYYRLNVIEIPVPPLTERVDDIPILVEHFLARFSREYQVDRDLSPDALRVLLEYHWPGNVRQLENLIARVILLSKGHVIEVSDLPVEVRRPHTPVMATEASMRRLKPRARQKFDEFVALAKCGATLADIQGKLGLSRATYYRWLAELQRGSVA